MKKATVSIDDWLKSTGATERPRAQQNTVSEQRPVTEPISEPVPQEKKENISFWEKLLNAFGDAGYSADTTLPTAPTNQAIMDDYRTSGFSESKTAQAAQDIAKSAYEGAKSAYTNAAGTLLNKREGTQIMGVTVADDAVSQEDKDKAEAVRQKKQSDIYALADAAAEASGEAAQRAKDNLGGGKAADFFVDVSTGGIQLGADMALNALLPGAGLVNMGLRSYGSATREARMDGASGGEQVVYGATVAAVDVLTEKMFDVGKLFGGGAADDVAEKLVGKLAKTDAGRSVVRALTNALGEGAEEAVADILNPAIRAIYDKGAAAKSSYTTAEGAKEMLAQAGYDALIGAALSTFGTTAGIMKGVDAQKNAALRSGEPASGTNTEASAKPAEAETIAAEARADAAPVETAQDVPAAQEKPQENSTLRMVEEAAGLREPAQSPAQERATEAAQSAERDANSQPQEYTPEDHIDNRTDEYVAKRSTKSFQYNHPELHKHFERVAEDLTPMIYGSMQSDRHKRGKGTITNNPRVVQHVIDKTGLSRPEILRALDAIIKDNGAENYANAKRVEKALDSLLVDGYTKPNGEYVAPDAAYMEAKSQISGGTDPYSWEYYRDNDLSLMLGEITEEESYNDWRAQHDAREAAKAAQEQSQKTGEIVNESAENAAQAQNSDNFADVQ